MGIVQALLQSIIDPIVIEAYVANRGLFFAQQMGFTKIILEGDAHSVILKILQPDPSLSNISNLIDDTKNIMKNFYCCQVHHVRREANVATH